MNVEDRVTAMLRDGLDRLDVSPGDPGTALSEGSRLRRRRTTTRVAAAAVAVVTVAGLGAVIRGGDGRLEPTPTPSGSWRELPAAPLSPRTGSIGVWTGDEAIFLGGQTDAFCPPTADCAAPAAYARDGAAYDPSTRTWTLIADAPVDIAYYTPHLYVSGLLVVVSDDRLWYAYDIEADTWERLPDPPGALQVYGEELSATQDSVYVLGKDGDVLELDLAGRTWSTLPDSAPQPRLAHAVLEATPEGIVKIGVDSTASNDGTVPSYLLADVYRDGVWQRAERSDMLGGYTWHWTGERLVSPSTTCVDGGEVNPYPRCIPEGGIFDPETAGWSPLPEGPSPFSNGWNLSGAGGPRMLMGDSLYDDSDASWTRLGAPEGAEDVTEGAAVVAGETVIAFGGIDWTDDWSNAEATDRAWIWSP